MPVSLDKLNVLALDCQATGANPEKGRIIEIGWTAASAFGDFKDAPAKMQSFLVSLPDDEAMPKRVERITGISRDELADGIEESEAWQLLVEAAHGICSGVCPAIIHFARFEEPFLRRLHREYTYGEEFPLDIICTHEIAKRILPDLPRRGLRAVAGYYGYSVDEFRRSTHHVAATVYIWRSLVETLAVNYGIHTLSELKTWLNETEASARTGRSYPLDSARRLGTPDKPGVYRMLRSNGDVLYVGKAKSLKRRVNSYFQKKSSHAEHILEMLSQAADIDVTVTGSALEAAVLENDEIKRLSPPYNKALRSRDRRLLFCDRSLTSFSARPDDVHTIGPLPTRETVESLGMLGGLIEAGNGLRETGVSSIPAVLGIPEEYAPDAENFLSGLDLFKQRHENTLTSGTAIGALKKLGVLLWFKRLAECEECSPDDGCTEAEYNEEMDNGNDGVAVDEGTWTPESAADALESVVRRGTHAVRRARWFCLLSESTLSWESRDNGSETKHIAVFENGEAVLFSVMKRNEAMPFPSGYDKLFETRRLNFDIPTYDRMRIVTTEIKRLQSEKRIVGLTTKPGVILDRDTLATMLKWV